MHHEVPTCHAFLAIFLAKIFHLHHVILIKLFFLLQYHIQMSNLLQTAADPEGNLIASSSVYHWILFNTIYNAVIGDRMFFYFPKI